MEVDVHRSISLMWLQGDERFIRALVFSLAMHAALIYCWPQRPASRETGAMVLEVRFSQSVPTLERDSQRVPQSDEVKGRSNVLTSQNPAPLKLPQRQEPTLSRQPSPATSIAESGDPSGKADATGSTSAAQSNGAPQARKPGQATMYIEVTSDGRIGQIIWGKLPAMDRETFRRLEAAIRARGYAGPVTDTFLRQTIDVREYLATEQPVAP